MGILHKRCLSPVDSHVEELNSCSEVRFNWRTVELGLEIMFSRMMHMLFAAHVVHRVVGEAGSICSDMVDLIFDAPSMASTRESHRELVRFKVHASRA